MGVDVPALKAAPADDERAAELIAECRSRLGGEWRLLSSSVKLRKVIFEAEYNGRRVIGKVSRSHRARTAYGSVTKLHEAGMRPPSEFTVPEPIAWFEDRKLLVLEKAPGSSVLEVMHQEANAQEHARRAAEWLGALHGLDVDVKLDRFDMAAAEIRAAELQAAIEDPRIATTAAEAIHILGQEPASVALSHGDYHPMNIYVAPHRVTAIDLDTVGIRPPEKDIGYFLAQTANFGLLMFDNFESTREVRETFAGCFPEVDAQLLSANMAWTLLQSLHFDACILKIKNEKADLMVKAARSVLSTGLLDSAEA